MGWEERLVALLIYLFTRQILKHLLFSEFCILSFSLFYPSFDLITKFDKCKINFIYNSMHLSLLNKHEQTPLHTPNK